jgi:hypothetical protein
LPRVRLRARGHHRCDSTTEIVAQLARASDNPGVVARHGGDAAIIIGGTTRKVQAVYEQPFLAHATKRWAGSASRERRA